MIGERIRYWRSKHQSLAICLNIEQPHIHSMIYVKIPRKKDKKQKTTEIIEDIVRMKFVD